MKQQILTTFFVFAFCVLSFAQTKTSSCPTIKINAPEGMINIGVPILFSIEQNKELQKFNIKYKWEVIGGKFLDGQATPRINVISEIPGETIKVKVVIQGLPENCVYTGTEFVNILPQHDYFPDEYGKISLKDEFARLDQLIVRVANAPEYQGFIEISIGEKESVAKTKKHIRKLIKYIEYRGFSKKRFVFAIRKTTFHKTVFHLFPKSSNFPNCEDCIILKGEDL